MAVQPFEFIDIGNIKAEPVEYDGPKEDPLATIKEEKEDLNFITKDSGNIYKLKNDVKPILNDDIVRTEFGERKLNDEQCDEGMKGQDNEHDHIYKEENSSCCGSSFGNIHRLDSNVKTESINDGAMIKANDKCKGKVESDEHSLEGTEEFKVIEHNPMYEDENSNSISTDNNVSGILVNSEANTEKQNQMIQLKSYREHNMKADKDNLVNVNIPGEIQMYQPCNYMTAHGGYLQQHAASTSAVRDNDKLYCCKYCNYKCSHKGTFTEHVSTVHYKETSFNCQHYNYNCSRKSHLETHISAVHNKETPYTCQFCSHKSKRKGDLKIHVSVVHYKEKRYMCQHCTKGFSRNDYLMRHALAVHNKETPYDCQLCTYTCSCKASLNRHISSVHYKEIVYSCQYCNKSFTLKQHLKSHISGVHIKETSHSCQLCTYKSYYKGHLKKHISAVHLKETRFSCQHCDYKCREQGKLKRHISAVHNKEKPYNCELCGYKCSLKANLKKHTLGVHFKRSTLLD